MTEVNDCFFCRIYEEGDEIEGENKYFYWRFDRYPVTPGHLEIIPKRHVESLLELPYHEWGSLRDALRRAVEDIEARDLFDLYLDMVADPLDENSFEYCKDALQQLLGVKPDKPDGYNFGVNEGAAAGRSIHHLHWHVIPRYEGDVENPRGGVRHIIPKKGNY